MADIVSGRIDAEGRLVEAGPRLQQLQVDAGGAMGSAVAIPALAGIARITRSLGVLISRSVICASGDHDLELLVRAKPDGDQVVLTLGGWTPRPPRRPWLVSSPDSAPVAEHDGGEWRWAADARLNLRGGTTLPGFSGRAGRPLIELMRLIEDERGAMPILEALGGRESFAGQRAVFRFDPGIEVVLAGQVVWDDAGEFDGFDGSARVMAFEKPAGVDSDAPPDHTFPQRLDAALRAPLGRIVANADSISAQTDGPLRRDYADYAGDIASAARHLLALVDDLSDLQAVERPDFRVEPEDIDLVDLARRAAGLLQVRAADRRVRVDKPGTSETLKARGDYRRVLQILVNLVGNAIRYSPEDAMVWIRTERDAHTAVLIVADQGKGIAIEDQARIFDKFERVDPSEPGGSGLGLFIARRLAQAMGGDIVVDSAPGQGARFVLTLPAA